MHARAMAARRHGKKAITGMYAVALPSFGGRPGLRDNFFFTRLLAGVEDEILDRDYELILSVYRPERLPRWLREGEVDGVICLNWDVTFFQTLQQKNLPFVTVQQIFPDAPGIATSEREGICQVTTYLLGLGHKRLAYLGLSGDNAPRRRLLGFQDALRAAGIPLDSALVNVSHVFLEHGTQATRELLDARRQGAHFTALVCHNDMLAMQAVRELERQGFRVPEDISVTGFDDLSAYHYFEPQLTGIAFDLEGMGRRAVQLLLESDQPGDTNENSEARHENYPVTLAVRQSHAAPAS